jgi:hypothetical protein
VLAALALALAAIPPSRRQPERDRHSSGANEPMAGAAVVVEELRQETRTGTDGAYRFERLAAGEYHVSVRADKHGVPRDVDHQTPNRRACGLARALRLRSGGSSKDPRCSTPSRPQAVALTPRMSIGRKSQDGPVERRPCAS